MVFKYIFVIILSLIFYYFIGMLHELLHIVFCKILNCKIIKYKVGFIIFDGSFKFSIKGNNFCNFKTDNKNKALVILLSGPLVNFAFLAISIVLLIINKDLMKFFLILTFAFNLVSIFFDLCPVTENDGKAILKIIKEKRQKR